MRFCSTLPELAFDPFLTLSPVLNFLSAPVCPISFFFFERLWEAASLLFFFNRWLHVFFHALSSHFLCSLFSYVHAFHGIKVVCVWDVAPSPKRWRFPSCAFRHLATSEAPPFSNPLYGISLPVLLFQSPFFPFVLVLSFLPTAESQDCLPLFVLGVGNVGFKGE